MSTTTIIVIAVAVLVLLIIIAAVMPRACESKRIRTVQHEHGELAAQRSADADEHARRAEIARAEAQRAEADATIARAEADSHAQTAEADPADLRGRETDDLRAGLDR